MLHGLRHLGDGGAAAAGHGHIALALARHLRRRIRRVGHGAGQFLHGGCSLLQAAGLRFGARRQFASALRHLRGGGRKALHFVAHIAHHGAQVDLDLHQTAHERAQRRRIVAARRGGQVAARDVAGKPLGLLQRGREVAVKVVQHDARAQPQRGSPPRHGRPARKAQHVGQQYGEGQHRQRKGHVCRKAQAYQALHPAAWAGVQQLALAQHQRNAAGLCLGAHARIQSVGRGHLVGRWLHPHRHVAHGLAAFQHRHHVGAHPVVVAVLAAVLDQPRPGLAAADGGPQVLEGRGGHVGMADEVVRLAHEFFMGIAAHPCERGIAVGDFTPGIGERHQQLIGGIVIPAARDRDVHTHAEPLKGQTAPMWGRQECE